MYICSNLIQFDNDAKKVNNNSCYVWFLTDSKFPRILNTLLVLIKEILIHNEIIGLDRISSHVIENYIGKIKFLCHDDNRFNTILHNIARYEYVTHFSPINFLVFNKKHENPGECKLRQSYNDGAMFSAIRDKLHMKFCHILISKELLISRC